MDICKFKDSSLLFILFLIRCFRPVCDCFHPAVVTNDAELEIAALTSSERTHWAVVRKTYFSEGSNKDSLDTIEESLFMVRGNRRFQVQFHLKVRNSSKNTNFGISLNNDAIK